MTITLFLSGVLYEADTQFVHRLHRFDAVESEGVESSGRRNLPNVSNLRSGTDDTYTPSSVRM